MAILPVLNNFRTSYNGFTFPSEYTYLTQYRIKPVLTSNGQSVKHVRATIGLHTKLSGTPADANVIDARRKLSQNGGIFQFGGRGTGPLTINTGVVKDVDHGPKVLDLDIRPIAGEQQVEIEWMVEINIPECGDASYAFSIADYSLTLSTQPRPNGRVNLVYSGELTIPNNRIAPGLRRLRDHPDRYRDRFLIELTPGFRREFQPFTVDASRTKLTFGWTDFEFDQQPYPPGCVKAEEGCSVASVKFGVSSTMTIRGKYELAADAPKDAGIKAFKRFMQEKYTSIKETQGNNKDKASIIPISFNFDDPDRFGPRVQNITAVVKVVGHNISTIIAAAGLWEQSKTPYQWTAWQASLRDSGLNPMGFSKITFGTMEEEIVDLCKRISSVQMSVKGNTRKVVDMTTPFADTPYPNSGTSWLEYSNNIQVIPDSGIASSITLTQTEPSLPSAPSNEINTPEDLPTSSFEGQAGTRNKNGRFIPAGTKADLSPLFTGIKGGVTGGAGATLGGASSSSGSGSSGGSTSGVISDPNYRATRRTNPSCHIIMYGAATRAGFPIPCPALLDVEGVKPVLDMPGDPSFGFTTGVIRKQGNVPIIGASWKLRYFLPKVPKGDVKAPGRPEGV